MSAPRFIQISTLTSYPAALLNRDDSGLAKRIRFGGAVRTRVSSQCLKRHWRMAEDRFALSEVDPSLTMSIRSRETFNREVLPLVIAKGVEESLAVAVLQGLGKKLYEGKEKDADSAKKADAKKEDKHPLARKEVVVLGRSEVEYLAEQAVEIARELGGSIPAAPKDRGKAIAEYLKKRYEETSLGKGMMKNLRAVCGAGLDAAMFGRFVSGDPEARVDSAVHVAHALTVHAEAAETDYFTAVDDLLTASEGGSGHLGAAELTSGLYYVYVVVDVPQLVSNLTGKDASDWLAADRSLAARTVKHLIHLMATVSPGAKLGATAPYDHAALVLAEAGERQPRTLANAFMNPIPLNGDVFAATVRALSGYLEGMDGMYGREEARWLACRLPVDGLGGFTGVERRTLPQLADAVEAAILQGA
ncbi:MAG: type I-E CRISPR-associated protein Cas7/Cse4/CasC [Desulfovibrio aminophilus]|uniref:type I-E CRISPR-associated protein Cas7/Cse4/CasC n=1 Tax=Desulfovibrio aminophilus TaxID=81425 RepID=UPI0039EAE74C